MDVINTLAEPKVARDDMEKSMGKVVISQNNNLNYQYDEKELIETK